MTEPAVPLSAEEIALITPRNCGARDVERLLATLAAKDAEYERLDADYLAMHDGLTDEISQQADVIRSVSKIVRHIGGSATLWRTVAALEAKLREAEGRASEATELAANLLSHIRFVLPQACGTCDVAEKWLAALQSGQAGESAS